MLYEDIDRYNYNKQIEETISHNFILDAEESNKKEYEGYEEYRVNEDNEILNREKFMSCIEEFHKREYEETYEVRLKDEQERIRVRGKVNNLRELRLDDLDKLREIRRDREEDFTYYMDIQYVFLNWQYITFYDDIYLAHHKTFLDCKKFKNETLINIFSITLEEQQHMKSIISKEEIKRRKNLKRRNDRRDSNGLTKRAKAKLEKEMKIKELIVSYPEITKSEVARIMNLSKSTITRCYGHLFYSCIK